MHWYVEFHNPVPQPGRETTLFEWAGGLPALTRMTRLLYEKHVTADPLLAPLFASMPPGHPRREAMWLAEIFGGPASYSQEFGGYQQMAARHAGRADRRTTGAMGRPRQPGRARGRLPRWSSSGTRTQHTSSALPISSAATRSMISSLSCVPCGS
jgi:hypothetical protein